MTFSLEKHPHSRVSLCAKAEDPENLLGAELLDQNIQHQYDCVQGTFQ